jgi:hypothetical protein
MFLQPPEQVPEQPEWQELAQLELQLEQPPLVLEPVHDEQDAEAVLPPVQVVQDELVLPPVQEVQDELAVAPPVQTSQPELVLPPVQDEQPDAGWQVPSTAA